MGAFRPLAFNRALPWPVRRHHGFRDVREAARRNFVKIMQVRGSVLTFASFGGLGSKSYDRPGVTVGSLRQSDPDCTQCAAASESRHPGSAGPDRGPTQRLPGLRCRGEFWRGVTTHAPHCRSRPQCTELLKEKAWRQFASFLTSAIIQKGLNVQAKTVFTLNNSPPALQTVPLR